MSADFVFTSGAVTCGHPDKLCDHISDAVVDRFLRQDPTARIEAECAVSGGVLFVASHSSAEATVDLAETARQIVADCGYHLGRFNAKDCSVMISQSDYPPGTTTRVDLSQLSENEAGNLAADHQVTLFGYACQQSETLMPLPVTLAHAMAKQLDILIADNTLHYLTPDAQVQVGVIYRNRKPVGIHSVTLLAYCRESHDPHPRQLRDDLVQAVVDPVLNGSDISTAKDVRITVNPEGPLVGGGPARHSGLTGRKIGIDTYGEYARQSSTALSGKDPLRIERIGTYAARHVAKHVVAARLAEECEIQLSYAVGLAEPVGVRVHTYGTGRYDDAELTRLVRQVFDLRPGVACKRFGLQLMPRAHEDFFTSLASYGQLGRSDLDLPWERLDRLDDLHVSD
jgi:S-adenosylmethionine synthetase